MIGLADVHSLAATLYALLAGRRRLEWPRRGARLPRNAEVLPPSEAAFDTGARAYRCMANDYGNEPSTSQFRR